MQCANQLKFCRKFMRPCDHVGFEASCPHHDAVCVDPGSNVPSIGEVRRMYIEMHSTGGDGSKMRPHNRAVLSEVGRFMRSFGLTDETTVDAISLDAMQSYIDRIGGRNITKIGICQRLQCFVGRKERIYYHRNGYTVRPTDVPVVKDDSRAYRSATPSRMLDVLRWYRGLCSRGDRASDPRRRIFVMLMFKYAMRNGDVCRLRWGNFERNGLLWRLSYTPHKTEESAAGRSVNIWLNPMDQLELEEFMGDAGENDFVIPREWSTRHIGIREMQRRLNLDMRSIGFTGSKGMYELRKMCIDRVFRLHGAEAASAYSGDDFKTVKFHYADTSNLNLHGLSDDDIGRTA